MPDILSTSSVAYMKLVCRFWAYFEKDANSWNLAYHHQSNFVSNYSIDVTVMLTAKTNQSIYILFNEGSCTWTVHCWDKITSTYSSRSYFPFQVENSPTTVTDNVFIVVPRALATRPLTHPNLPGSPKSLRVPLSSSRCPSVWCSNSSSSCSNTSSSSLRRRPQQLLLQVPFRQGQQQRVHVQQLWVKRLVSLSPSLRVPFSSHVVPSMIMSRPQMVAISHIFWGGKPLLFASVMLAAKHIFSALVDPTEIPINSRMEVAMAETFMFLLRLW